MSRQLEPEPRTLKERMALLDRAWALHDGRNFRALAELLEPLGEGVLMEEPELCYLLAKAWYEGGSWDNSLSLLRQLTKRCQRQGNDRLFRRRMTLEGVIVYRRGEMERAETLHLEVLEAAEIAGDELYVAYAWTNLGIIADIRCQWTKALSNYQRAMATYHRLGDNLSMGLTYWNIAMANRQLGWYQAAEVYFERALALLRLHAGQADIAGCELERSLLLNLKGDRRLASAAARHALDTFVQLGHTAGEGNGHCALGIIAASEGWRADARRHFEYGLTLARAAGDLLIEAEILEELANLEHVEWNLDASAEREEEARRAYRKLGAIPRIERMERHLAETRLAAGRGG